MQMPEFGARSCGTDPSNNLLLLFYYSGFNLKHHWKKVIVVSVLFSEFEEGRETSLG